MSSLPTLDLPRPLLASVLAASPLLYAGIPALLLVAAVVLWLLLGGGPRRARGLRRVHRLLQQSDWQQALSLVGELQGQGSLSPYWEGRLRTAEGECLRAGGVAAVQAKEFEKGLDLHLRAAALLRLNEQEVRASVIEHMLAEVRALFAATGASDTGAVYQMIARVLVVQPSCPEAFFWQGLCHLRDGVTELALSALARARGEDAGPTVGPAGAPCGAIDPSLYLGGLLLRAGQAKDSLRYLTEANRMDSNCPLVTLQLGTAMIQAGGDAQIAVRAMQRALGPRGLPMWLAAPERFWVEAFPEHRSFVRRLASRHRYVCPLWGGDLQQIIRQGNIALGQGLYRLGSYQEAAGVFTRLMHEAAPSLPVLRGLGLALARLGQYDQAFKHLRAAHELEEPKDRITAGYLALCGARGTPPRPEDRQQNISWAIRTVCQFSAPGDAEWVGLLSQIFAEARALEMPVAVGDQLHLCSHLISVNATDPTAAEAIHHLAATNPDAVRPVHAWLYCQAVRQHDLTGPQTLELFARTFTTEADARPFFAARAWDFDALEYAFLRRAAQDQPGQFPPVLGPDYPPRGEAFLLERSAQHEQAGNADAALETADVLHRLAPASPRALDRLAQLHYQKGGRETARELLAAWLQLEPANFLPLARLAVLEQQLGQTASALDRIRQALTLTFGKARAEVAFLGARLALTSLPLLTAGGANGDGALTAEALAPALELMLECLKEQPDHPQALWVMAALRQAVGDQQGLAAQAPQMNRADIPDARYHYLAAVCRLAAGDHAGVLEACQRAAADPALAVESAYLSGWAYLHRQETAEAAQALRQVAKAPESPSAAHAQALLGGLRFHDGAYDEALHWWKAIDPQRRATWQLDAPLQQTTYLAALAALQSGRYEQAAEKLREAGRLGLRERRLGPLLMLTLVKAGQKLLYGG